MPLKLTIVRPVLERNEDGRVRVLTSKRFAPISNITMQSSSIFFLFFIGLFSHRRSDTLTVS